MMKKTIVSLLIAVFCVVSVTASVQAADKGNKRKGKFMYRKVYKDCHKANSAIPAKPTINPDVKTQAQWKRVFDKKKFDMFGCKEQWDKLSEKDLLNIYTYLYSGAADSPTPAKCK